MQLDIENYGEPLSSGTFDLLWAMISLIYITILLANSFFG